MKLERRDVVQVSILNLHALSIRPRRLKSPASTDRRYLKIQRCVLRVAALFNELFRGLLRRADLHQHRLVAMRNLAKVSTQAALSIVYLQHLKSPFNSCLTQRVGMQLRGQCRCQSMPELARMVMMPRFCGV